MTGPLARQPSLADTSTPFVYGSRRTVRSVRSTADRRQPPAGRGGCDKLRRAAQRRKAWWRLPAPRALVRPLLTRDISRRVSPRAPRQTAPVVRRRSEVHHVVRRIHHLHHRAAAFRPSRSSPECRPADKLSRRGFSPCSSAADAAHLIVDERQHRRVPCRNPWDTKRATALHLPEYDPNSSTFVLK